MGELQYIHKGQISTRSRPQLLVSHCTDGLQMKSPCKIRRKAKTKVLVLGEALEGAIN